MKEIDTKVRHVTTSDANLFSELGFTPEEAKQYLAESRARIYSSQIEEIKNQLMNALALCIKTQHLKQAEAAKLFAVSRPRISDVVNKKTSKFTIDALVNMLMRIGKPVKVVIG